MPRTSEIGDRGAGDVEAFSGNPTPPCHLGAGSPWYPAGQMALDTHAAVKTLTDAGADEALAVAVVEVAREASTEATGELVTRAHFDTALAQLESRLGLAPGDGRHRDRGRRGRGAAVPRLKVGTEGGPLGEFVAYVGLFMAGIESARAGAFAMTSTRLGVTIGMTPATSDRSLDAARALAGR